MAVGRIDDPHWDDPARPRTRLRRKAGGAALVIMILLIGLASAAGRSREDFGTFRFWDYPQRINYCGRRYYPAGTASGTHQTLSAEVDGPTEWKTVAHTFTLRRIEGPTRKPDAGSSVCALSLYVSDGAHRYRAYDLSGSP